ncbi:unnamed protein product [Arctia plantaginis]|uniref:Uncharacterized protein n=1 Tax=Arctia plantaginis TaxID=874455 RepID=A0A8S1AHC1_ARCPL|nr:unnamed protein product [Arctia plantaginis]
MFLDLEWWQICLVALIAFLGFLFTNYIMKKINEARIEERYARLAQGQDTNQGTQYEELGLKSLATKGNVPTEENKPAMARPRKQISLTSNKDESIHQDYRTQKVASIPKANNAGGLKEVVEKNANTLPCTVRIKQEKPTDLTSDTAIEPKNNSIKNASKHILANIVFPISEIVQNSEVTASTDGITHQFKEKITNKNVLSPINNIGIQINEANSNNFQILDRPENKIIQKIIDNSSLKSNEMETNITEAIKYELPEISHKIEEPMFGIDSEIKKTENVIIEKASTDYNNQTPETSKNINKSPLLSKEILPQEKKVSIKNSDFLKTEILQAAVETLSQKTSISSLINSFSNVKATNTQEIAPPDELKKDDNHPSTTIGLVMLDVSQKVGYSLFHNTNDFKYNNEHEVTNVTIESANIKATENSSSLTSSNLDTKSSNMKNITLAKDVVVKITTSDADPQTSKLKKKSRKKLTPTLGDSSKTKYTRNLKSFWEIFLSYRRS